MSADVVAELHERLRRHPADQHPLQHATAQFHLGAVLLSDGELDAAEHAFAQAAALFAARGAHPEQGKALVGLGATLRTAGRPALAARAFAHAAARFAGAQLALEEGAARFNLGLVLREDARTDAAVVELERAVALLDPAAVAEQAAAALRELGATRLGGDDLDGAREVLRQAVSLADRAGDRAGRGAALNALGIAALAAGQAPEAVEAFEAAAADSPRALRPEAFAMAKANLALAHEAAGGAPAARLAARQALGVAACPADVRVQAAGIVERLTAQPADLRAVLEHERDDERRARIVREELLRAADLGDADLVADMYPWLDAHTATELDPVAIAELWLGGLLELPPDQLERFARAAVTASTTLAEDDRETFRTAVGRATARFHVPQMLRLQDVFASAAAAAGDPSSWR